MFGNHPGSANGVAPMLLAIKLFSMAAVIRKTD